jgi:hypothetical protein
MESLDDSGKGDRVKAPMRVEQLAIFVVAMMLFVWCAVLLRQIANYNYADTFGPTLVALGEITLVPDSAAAHFYGSARTMLPVAMAAVCSALDVTPESLHRAVTLGTMIVGLLGPAAAAATIARTWWAGVLVVASMPFAWVFALSVGYHAPFWTGYALAGYWGLGWVCAVWGVWFVGPQRGWRAYLPFCLTGLVFLAHPGWGLVLFAVLGLDEAIGLWTATGARREALRSTAFKACLVALVAAPEIVLILGNLTQPDGSESNDAWWTLMQFRKSFHVFIWEGGMPFAQLAKLAILTALCTAVARPLLDGGQRRRLAATILGVSALVMLSYGSVEIVPIPSIAAIVVSRGMALLAAAAIVLVAAAVMAAREQGVPATLALYVALLALAIPAELEAVSWISNTLMATMPAFLQPANHAGFSFLVAATALATALLFRRTGRAAAMVPSHVPPMRSTAAAALAIVVTFWKLPLVPASQGAVPPATWTALTDCVRERTPRTALLVTPPYPYSIASTRRSFILDYVFLGASIYNAAMTPFEFDALRAIYGVDLRGKSRDDVRQYLARNKGILCLLERAYRELLADEGKVRALKAAYPSASHLVGFRPGVTPHEWTCGKHESPVLPLPTVCANDDYVLYDLSALSSDPESRAEQPRRQ